MIRQIFVLIVATALSGFWQCSASAQSTKQPTPSATKQSETRTGTNQDETRPATRLEYTPWSGELNVPDPVSISFDETGRAYVTQTTRRKSQDLDIRQHRDWIPDDLGLDSVLKKRQFYRDTLSPKQNAGAGEANSEHVSDFNDDGSYDYRDLMKRSEKIHLVEDSDGDGTADKISVFAEDFKTEVTGIAAGVLHHNGDVYATIAPDVWKLRDVDGDGAADARTAIATGFGFHIAYAGHDMHGLTVGPDGKIYWSIGDKGVNVTSKEGRRFYYPNQGAVLRCNPDGSDFEVFAYGLRNVQELAFDQFGNLFGFDNDSDQPGEKERFVHIVYGMDSGWRCNYQYRGDDYNPWVKERMWEPFDMAIKKTQPSYIVPPIANSVDGPCGFAFNPGTALSSDYKDYFFLTSTMAGEQLSFKIEPHGDSFKLVNQHQIGKGIPMIGIAFGPDGGLYGVDWAGGYPLNQKGKIWKIDDNSGRDEARTEIRVKTAAEIRRDYTTMSVPNLLEMLGWADQRVRLKSQFELVRRNAFQEFADTFVASAFKDDEASQLKAIHSVWGIGQLARASNEAARKWIDKKTLQHVDKLPTNVLVALIRTAGDTPGIEAQYIVDALEHYNPRVRQVAAIAIGQLGTPHTENALREASRRTMPNETYLRHAIAFGIAGIEYKRLRNSKDDWKDATIGLSVLAEANSIIAIRKLNDMLKNDGRQLNIDLSAYLSNEDEGIAIEAARAIHDDFSIESALPQLAQRLNETSIKQEAFLRRAINANYRIGDAESLARVLEFATNPNSDSELRFEALYAVSTWSKPDLLDRVTGRHRGHQPERVLEPKTLELVRRRLLASLEEEVSSLKAAQQKQKLQPAVALISTLGKLKMDIPPGQLVSIFDSQLPDAIRAEALAGMFAQQLDSNSQATAFKSLVSAIESSSSRLRTVGLEIAAKHKPEVAASRIVGFLNGRPKVPTGEQQMATALLSSMATPTADQIIVEQLTKLHSSSLPESLYLETLEAASIRSAANPKIKELLDRVESQRLEIVAKLSEAKPDKDVAPFLECLVGGDKELGKNIFNTHIDAQCVRCHRVGGKGSNVGPELSKVAVREPAISDPMYLLRSIVSPSAQIDEKYKTVMFLLANGEVVKGVVLKEAAGAITVVDEAGKEIKIDVDEIEDESENAVSMMPIAETLTKREIRDLVAYLNSLKGKPEPK